VIPITVAGLEPAHGYVCIVVVERFSQHRHGIQSEEFFTASVQLLWLVFVSHLCYKHASIGFTEMQQPIRQEAPPSPTFTIATTIAAAVLLLILDTGASRP